MNLDRLHQLTLIDLEQTSSESQEINFEFLSDLNNWRDYGWTEWHAYISPHGNAVYCRSTNE